MNPIDPRLLFSRPRPLHSGPNRQVLQIEARLARSAKSASIDCVLKFFSPTARTLYDKELAVYQRLSEIDGSRPKFRGNDEWSREKYLKVVGRGNESLTLDDSTASPIFVIMLEYIQNSRPLSAITPVPLDVSKLALSSLAELHDLGIVHGDVSKSNALLIESPGAPSEVVWVDFASSWTDASLKQITWESHRAVEYFSQWVKDLKGLSNV